MNAIIFIGLQASGKSTFFQRHFADTHVRVNLDMLRTRHREQRLMETCLEIGQSVAIDNTNVTKVDRAAYLVRLRGAGVPVTGYYFQSGIDDCKARNEARAEHARIPLKGLLGTYARLELPSLDEGFAQLFYVRITDNNDFAIEEWRA